MFTDANQGLYGQSRSKVRLGAQSRGGMGQLGVSTDKCPESRKLSEHINSIHGQSAEKSLILEKHLLVRVFKDR